VSRVIEPLKAKVAVLLPEQARHSRALRRIVAKRGRVDPGALVLNVQGLHALVRLPRIVRLLLRGKINPLRTLFGTKTPAAEPARRLLGRETSQ
jgi:succinate dehydrogenase / fumarate reductase iron-sulfur subunit